MTERTCRDKIGQIHITEPTDTDQISSSHHLEEHFASHVFQTQRVAAIAYRRVENQDQHVVRADAHVNQFNFIISRIYSQG